MNTNDFKVGSFIQMLEDFIEKIETAVADTDDADDRSSTHSESRNVSLKLPKITLPTFSDKYSEWTPFFDLFQNTVDCNRSLNDIQKLQYLKTSLKDQPARLLSHLPTTSANYNVALRILKERYDNKRMIIRSHLDAIVKFSPMQHESADQLRKLITVFMENSLALTALGEDVDAADYVWVYLLSEKLDSETRHQWELHSPSDKPQTADDLLKFLEERARALDFSMPKNTDTAKAKDTARFKDKGNVEVYHNQATTNCPKCSENHGIFNCSDFNSLSIEDRVQFVKNNKLCFNCLRTGHSSKDCKSKSGCRICKKRHNTLLHRPLVLKKDEVTPSPVWVMGDTLHVQSLYYPQPSSK